VPALRRTEPTSKRRNLSLPAESATERSPAPAVYGDFILIIKTRNRGDHISVKTVRPRPGMYRSPPTAMALAKRIKLVEGPGKAGFIHDQANCDEPGIIRLTNLSHSNP
jgi:hypothetical protein